MYQQNLTVNFNEMLEKATQGDAEAQCNLGSMYTRRS